MKKGQSSRTAEGAAALRASHLLHAASPVFADPYALAMTSDGWRKLLGSPLVKVMNSAALSPVLGMLIAQVVARSRYAEDLLEQALNKGTNQYVLVGAGLDSFALRQRRLNLNNPNLKIFEVDHPDTQAVKQKKLRTLGDIAANVEFVAIDFEKESIADALDKSSYQPNQPGFFSWLGTTHYLEPQTTLNTLRSIAGIAASGSEIVLDYSIHYSALQGLERLGSMALSQFTSFLKEPLIGQFIPAELHQELNSMGYAVVEDLSGNGLTERYFKQRDDGIRHTRATHMLHLRKGWLEG